jgi:hypothetical protein
VDLVNTALMRRRRYIKLQATGGKVILERGYRNQENKCSALVELVTRELKVQSFYERRQDVSAILSAHSNFQNVNSKSSPEYCESDTW